MGAFRIRALSVNSKTGIGIYTLGGGPTVGVPSDVDLLTIVNKVPFNASFNWGSYDQYGVGLISFFPDADGIFLDGSLIPVGLSGLPPGFNVLTARVEASVGNNGDASAFWTLFNGAFESAHNASFFAYPSPVTLAGILITDFGLHTSSNILSNLNGTYTIITGTYDIVITTASITPNPIVPGTTVTITSPASTPDLSTFTNLTLEPTNPDEDPVTIPAAAFLTQSPTSITFTWPVDAGIAGDRYVVSGVTFSGSVLLQTVNILIADASGIYTLVEGKRTDTLYIDSPDDNTLEVKIPNPFIKTGFIGG